MADEKKQEIFSFQSRHRGCYVDIERARAFKKKAGTEKFGATFIIDPAPKLVDVDGKSVDMSDLAQLKRAVTRLLQSKAPGKKLSLNRLTQEQVDAGNYIEVKAPWRSGDKEADSEKAKGKDGELYRGKILVKSSSKFQPRLAYIENGKVNKIEAEEPESAVLIKKFFYSGAEYVPSFELHWYKGDEGKPDGVNLYLNSILFAKHGARIRGGGQNPEDTFKGYVGTISNEDPTGGAAGVADELGDDLSDL